jgi:hypothetical protein
MTDARERELATRRDRLEERFTLMQAELGGLFYEMAIRDHVRMDVLTRKAADLQRVDEELAEVGRELAVHRAGAAGTCAACATPFTSGSAFCSGCGQPLPAGAPTAPEPTEAPA